MSSEPAIQLQGLSKSYPVYSKPHHRLLQMLSPDPRRWYREFHALRNIDLSVARGETLGIVGRNGSGKSTLLQLICGTLAPTSGSVRVNGRIAALLELGAGFNPDFTGRENVFLNGSILGLSHDEVEQRFDAIAAFADIGEFIEQPVKTYSSGMYVRLAFAVAINVEPDILVIDEALSVGDEGFQRKCFARIEAIRSAGATVLFVSHSAGTVVDLCDRAVLLDHGELIAAGTPKHVVSRYQKLLYAPQESIERVREEIRAMDVSAANVARPHAMRVDAGGEDQAYWEPGLIASSTVAYEHRGATIENPHLQTPDGRRVNVLTSGHEYDYVFRVLIEQALLGVRCGMMIRTITGVEIGGAVTSFDEDAPSVTDGGTVLLARIRFRCRLAPGTYFMNAGVVARFGIEDAFAARVLDAVMFRVMPQAGRLATGLVDLEVNPGLCVESGND
jgi:lipopolysaccharide transport system ATP-binding protein